MKTIGDYLDGLRLDPRRDDELERHLNEIEVAERLLIKDEDGEPPHYGLMTRRQLLEEARRVLRAEAEWVKAQDSRACARR